MNNYTYNYPTKKEAFDINIFHEKTKNILIKNLYSGFDYGAIGINISNSVNFSQSSIIIISGLYNSKHKQPLEHIVDIIILQF